MTFAGLTFASLKICKNLGEYGSHMRKLLFFSHESADYKPYNLGWWGECLMDQSFLSLNSHVNFASICLRKFFS